LLGDFDLAEDALHDAFTAALQRWPKDGVPANPRAWCKQPIEPVKIMKYICLGDFKRFSREDMKAMGKERKRKINVPSASSHSL
jgi:predicted RNA polymerase sigma factor